MTVTSPKLVLTCAAIASALTLNVARASAQEPQLRFQQLLDRAVEGTLRAQASQATTASPTPGMPAPSRAAVQPAPGSTGVIPLTLDDAVKAALDHNLNIAVSRLNPQLNDFAYSNVWANFLPAVTSQLATQ